MNVNNTYVDLAERLAEASGEIVSRYFRSLPKISEKPDLTPLTIADCEAEAAMREIIEAEYPNHGIVGEEGGIEKQMAKFDNELG